MSTLNYIVELDAPVVVEQAAVIAELEAHRKAQARVESMRAAFASPWPNDPAGSYRPNHNPHTKLGMFKGDYPEDGD